MNQNLLKCLAFSLAASAFGPGAPAQQPAAPPVPNARFGNWLYLAPDPQVWKPTTKDGKLILAVGEPPGDFCTLTLFAGAEAGGDFALQFDAAVAADQKAKDTVKIEADSGAKPVKSEEGYDVITRSLRAETSALHTFHLYLGTHSRDRFDLMAFQTTSEGSWKQYGAQASEFIRSLKLANTLSPEEVEKLVGATRTDAAPPPTLPGFGDAPAPASAKTPDAAVAVKAVPDLPLEQSLIVKNHVVAQKNGKFVDGIKLSQHDTQIGSPMITVAPDGVIHVAFVEQHRTTLALAVYHRSSSDGGATWTEAKNLSEDMAGIIVGRCAVLADSRNRVYVIWRAGLNPNYQPSIDPAGGSTYSNLYYRVLEGGKWSGIKPVHPPATQADQFAGSLSYFAAIDAAGRAQVVWNTNPNKSHPELTRNGSALPGIGNGLVLQATLDGATASPPREIFLSPVTGLDVRGGYEAWCDGLDTLNGYVDAAGSAHFIAADTGSYFHSLQGISRYELIENGAVGPMIDLPDLSFHAWRDVPTLLVDAAGRRHVIVLFPAGERPNLRDYLIGSDEEPVVIRAAASVNGTVIGLQACQGPGGRMVALMQMNDTGVQGNAETYVSISTGKGWSPPVNVTNNGGRQSFASTQTSSQSNVAVIKGYAPGPAAAAFDREGHLLLLMINNEYGLFASTAFGVQLAAGSSSTPKLQFLRF